MKERGSGLKTSNKFMESVFSWKPARKWSSTMPCRPSWKSVLKLRMLPCRYLEEMGQTSHSSWKGIISPMLQEAESPPTLRRKSEIMLTPSCTLKRTLWRKAFAAASWSTGERDPHSSKTRRQRRWRVPVKVAFENNSVKYFFSLTTNAFCRQRQKEKEFCNKFVSCLLCLFYSIFFLDIQTLCHFKVLPKYFTWPLLFPLFFCDGPPRKPFFFACSSL